MHPQAIEIFGYSLAAWDAALLAGIVVGFFFLRFAFSYDANPTAHRLLALRYGITVYLCTIGAQALAYLADKNTTVTPPADLTLVDYYLNPFAGPKTLYGAIIVLPFAVLITALPYRRSSFADLMGRWTPALMIVLAFARVGCLLEGCCYGVRTEAFGLRFAPGSVVHGRQVQDGIITAGMASVPVVPTQVLEVALCLGLALRALWEIRRGNGRVFARTIVVYAAARLLVEFVRADPDRGAYGMLATSQWISLGILGLWLISRVQKWQAEQVL